MRLRRLAAAVACLVGVGAVPASGAWGDSSQADGGTLELLSLVAPTLACENTSLTSVTISWQAQTSPTTMDYTASVAGIPLTVTSTGGAQRQVVVTGTLLQVLLGGTKVVSVTGSLPGTSWTSGTSTRNVLFTVIGLLVSCA